MKPTNIPFDEIRQRIQPVNARILRIAHDFYYQGKLTVQGDFIEVFVMNGTAHVEVKDLQGFVKCRATDFNPVQVREQLPASPFGYRADD